MNDRVKRAECAARELAMLMFVLDDMKGLTPYKLRLYALSLILSGWRQVDHTWH